MATGLLLINLGTPDAPTPGAVRRYLREFLGDPRVLDINPVGRALLLNLVILPLRPRKSAHAYAQIWDRERGSPLLFHSQDLTAGVAARLGTGWHVELAMRYGAPSIADALDRLVAAGVDRVIAVPLFPQYASSSTGSALERLYQLAGQRLTVPPLSVVPAFYDDDGFIDAFVAVARPRLDAFRPDHVLMSFHGLPERHMTAGDPTGSHCLASPGCCDRIVAANQHCYRAQAYATARSLAAGLGLVDDGWSVSFQSRLGRTPWIKPYTDEVLPQLAARGVKRLSVMCPAFVADCLETLEEIGMRAAGEWKASGGEALELVPSLNAGPAWIDAVVAMARRAAGEPAVAAAPAASVA
ncbi:MAG TPA: ferrochelatase [Kofleriaceae bacterium]|nr:ferrochelatase [Kofleriaceae bacterium]